MKANPSASPGLLRGLAWIAAVACLNSAAPVSAQLFGGDDTARRQIAEQAKRIDALSQQLARIEDSLKSAGSNPALELSQQLERLRQEVMQLRGQIEVLNNETQTAAKRSRDTYLDLDTRMKRLEQPSAAAPAAAAPSGGDAKPAQAAAAAQATDAETRAYEAAQNQRKIGNYPAAIAGFQTFLAQ